MTERSKSERAELVAELKEFLDRSCINDNAMTFLRKVETALRRLAAQDQKPVAWRTRWRTEGPHEPGDWSYYNQKPPQDHKRYEVEPLYLSPPPAAGWDQAIQAAEIEIVAALPDHGGADAGVKAQIATIAHRFWTIHPRELQDKGMTREDFYIREMTALVAAISKPAPVADNLEITDFNERPSAPWPDPTPAMLNGDPLFDAIWQTIKSWDVNVPAVYSGYCGASGNHVRAIYDAVKSAPVAANASDCDKHEEAKCPECGGSGSIEIDDGHFIKCKCAPSDRTADVTVEQAARKCADDLVLIVEAATKMAHRTGNTFVIDRVRVASMIAGHFNAFTVGRR